MTTTTRRRSPRKLDIGELFAALEEHELTAPEIARRFGVSRPQATKTLTSLTARGLVLWSWDSEHNGRRRPARRYRLSTVRPNERPPRPRRALDQPISEWRRARVIQLLRKHGELTIGELAAVTRVFCGYISAILGHLHAEGRADYRLEQRAGRGQHPSLELGGFDTHSLQGSRDGTTLRGTTPRPPGERQAPQAQ